MRVNERVKAKVCPFCKKDEPADESWLLTYGDAVTLILTFLVLIISVSTIDQSKYEKVVESMQTGLGGQTEVEVSHFEQLKIDIQEISKQNQDAVEVTRDPEGLTLELASSDLFLVGSADIQPDAIKILDQIAVKILEFGQDYQNYQVEIEGHTDDVPIRTLRFPSNWELSANRATNVVKRLIAQGVDKHRLKAAGYADLFPKAPNRDADGNPIAENQAQNRRIVILVHRKD